MLEDIYPEEVRWGWLEAREIVIGLSRRSRSDLPGELALELGWLAEYCRGPDTRFLRSLYAVSCMTYPVFSIVTGLCCQLKLLFRFCLFLIKCLPRNVCTFQGI